MSTPFDTPRAFDTISLDGIPFRGMVRPATDADRIAKIEQVMAPGFAGAFTIMRLEEMVTLDYVVEVITIDDYNWLKTMLQVLRQGQKLRPPKGPRVYEFQDLTIEHCEVRRVACYKLTRLKHVGKGKHTTLIGFAEWKKKIPIGGPPAARPKTDVEKEIERINNDNKALQAQLDSLKKGK